MSLWLEFVSSKSDIVALYLGRIFLFSKDKEEIKPMQISVHICHLNIYNIFYYTSAPIRSCFRTINKISFYLEETFTDSCSTKLARYYNTKQPQMLAKLFYSKINIMWLNSKLALSLENG